MEYVNLNIHQRVEDNLKILLIDLKNVGRLCWCVKLNYSTPNRITVIITKFTQHDSKCRSPREQMRPLARLQAALTFTWPAPSKRKRQLNCKNIKLHSSPWIRATGRRASEVDNWSTVARGVQMQGGYCVCGCWYERRTMVPWFADNLIRNQVHVHYMLMASVCLETART
jgi:hypothetical protein